MDLDISQGPLSDSSKEEEEEEEEESPPYLNSKVTVSRLNLDEAEGIPSGLSEGLLLSTLEGFSDSTPRDALRNDLPRIHSDRSISPSVSSSISVVSSTGGRRNLEWDSGADLGYCGPESSLVNKKSGPELSALEKLAIRNYKEILGPPNDAPQPSAFHSYQKNKKEFEIEKLRLKKFGDFLLRHNDHIDSTPSVSKLLESPAALRSYESISPLSPIRSESNRRVHRRSKSWSDIRCSEHEGFVPSKSFKNLRGSSPIEPSSSSSTGTVIPALHPQRSSEFVSQSRINVSMFSSVEAPCRMTSGSSNDSSSKGDNTLQNPEDDNIQRSSTTSEEETKVLKLSVKVTRSPPVLEDTQSDIRSQHVSSERNIFSPDNSYKAVSKRTLFKLYKRKLSHYIQIISTPSLTYGESKMKQKLAGKLMSLMKEDVSHHHPHDIDSPNSTSSLKLEREMKKLDKLERKLLKCVPSLSLYKSDASLTTTTESLCSSFKEERVLTSHLSQLSISSGSVTSLKSNQDISECSSSNAETRSARHNNLRQDSVAGESKSITSMPTQVLNVPRLLDRNSPPEMSSKKTSNATSDNFLSLTETESDKGLYYCGPLTSQPDLARSDFGQTYPSPSDVMSKVQCTQTQTLLSVNKKSEFVQTCPSSKGSSFEEEITASSLLTRQEEVFYALKSKENTTYKSLDNVQLKPIPPETSISKSNNSFYFFELNSKQRGKKYIEDFCMSKENRNIISNHVSGLDLNSRRRKPLCKVPKDNSTLSSESISLQDSLVKNHPSFLARSRKRIKLLREAREQRLIEQERKKAWLLSIASLSPESRRKAELSYVPIKTKRVFNHKKMVEETRRRCQNLPEVVRVQRDLKRAESYRTNRIMLDLYNRKVKTQLFKRRIRSAH